MESGWCWEQQTLIAELVQGMELAKQLRAHLNATSSVEGRDELLQRILASYERALLILNWGGSMGQPQSVGVSAGVPESPISINGSSRSDEFDGGVKDNQGYNEASKKRKTTPRWTDHVRVSPENGLEGPHDDGYSWRKYGQKDILGAKYPRSYYRCTYRNTQNCWATKQVQRSDEDPTIFEITYRGTHTCAHGNQSIPSPSSPEKQEKKQKNTNNNYQQQQSQQALYNFQNSLKVITEDLDNKEMVSPFSFPSAYGCSKNASSYSPSFISPATPEPTHYSVSPFQMNNFGGAHNLQHLESDFTEIISANTSATNSPIVNLDFSLDQVELDPNFPFDTPGFFS
ncbi:PREDICTED: probable WRKY transcription factor 41 [Populus euphratica]|uniref:Probable WRKY transcription factor 41 n=1 Tax=Populus euphratica TaxID=75702 RepID=A0AAJ6U394_POPEU|nr:PREDICTED: probable WRKY transcription factor 41 [Populus euphratica]